MIYAPRLCIHGHNEITCSPCRTEYEAWLERQDNEAYLEVCRAEAGT
jgi:hypothetical protein